MKAVVTRISAPCSVSTLRSPQLGCWRRRGQIRDLDRRRQPGRARPRPAGGDRRDRGFTRGAIYKNFHGKEDLFFAVTDRLNEQVIQAFRSIAPDSADTKEWDISTLADMWRASVDEFEDLFAISKEYKLYVLRNPDARERALAHRRKQRALVAAFIDEIAERSGMTLRRTHACQRHPRRR
jgi:AcrR family transcriptional regulator